MFIEFIDLLRCPRTHSDSWLVAAFQKMDARFVVTGKLGCPVCDSVYPITAGVADFRGDRLDGTRAIAVAANSADSAEQQKEENAVRVAAFLGLTRPDSLVVLTGRSASHGANVSALAEARVIALNPVREGHPAERVAAVLADFRFPLAPFSVDGIVLDSGSNPLLAADAARVLRQGGRLVAPATLHLGPGFRELARDDNQVVAESIGELVSISR